MSQMNSNDYIFLTMPLANNSSGQTIPQTLTVPEGDERWIYLKPTYSNPPPYVFSFEMLDQNGNVTFGPITNGSSIKINTSNNLGFWCNHNARLFAYADYSGQCLGDDIIWTIQSANPNVSGPVVLNYGDNFYLQSQNGGSYATFDDDNFLRVTSGTPDPNNSVFTASLAPPGTVWSAAANQVTIPSAAPLSAIHENFNLQQFLLPVSAYVNERQQRKQRNFIMILLIILLIVCIIWLWPGKE